MNKKALQNSFPEPTREFHEKLCQTLDNLGERENIKMKKFTVKKGLIIAAAVSILVIGSAAIATQGTSRVISSSSWSFPTYKDIPSAETLQKDIGIAPKIIEEFTNGYAYKDATKVDNSVDDITDSTRVTVVDENGQEQKFTSVSLCYVRDGKKIDITCDPVGYDLPKGEEAENYNGISIGYTSFMNKFVPGNYQQTEQDIKDEDEGKYVFSYGTEDIEIHFVQGVAWEQDGIRYHINAMDSPLGQEELIAMAKEIIDFK